MHVWALGLSCETPTASNPSHTNHQNSTRRQPERDIKRAKKGTVEGKKSEHLGLPPFGTPIFLCLPHPPHLQGRTLRPPSLLFGPHHDTHQIKKWIGQKLDWQKLDWPNLVLAKIGFGQNWPGQNHDGQKWIGQNWTRFEHLSTLPLSTLLGQPVPQLTAGETSQGPSPW